MSSTLPAITVWQPWASLIAIGAKPFETRSWAPPRRLLGRRIAIHASALSGGKIAREMSLGTPGRLVSSAICGALMEAGLTNVWGDLPHRAVLCTATLVAAYRCGHLNPGDQVYVEDAIGVEDAPILIDADPFGDFSPGRWAWHLTDIEPLDKPIPAIGHQGFWNWTPPTRLATAPGGHPASLQE